MIADIKVRVVVLNYRSPAPGLKWVDLIVESDDGLLRDAFIVLNERADDKIELFEESVANSRSHSSIGSIRLLSGCELDVPLFETV